MSRGSAVLVQVGATILLVFYYLRLPYLVGLVGLSIAALVGWAPHPVPGIIFGG